MNETFNKNGKVEKLTNMQGIAVCLNIIDPLSDEHENVRNTSCVSQECFCKISATV